MAAAVEGRPGPKKREMEGTSPESNRLGSARTGSYYLTVYDSISLMYVVDWVMVLVLLLNGILPESIACNNSTDPEIVNIASGALLTVYAIVSASFVIPLALSIVKCNGAMNVIKGAVKSREVDLLEKEGEGYQTKYDPLLTSLNGELRKWRSLRSRYGIAAIILVLGILSQAQGGYSYLSDIERESVLSAEDIYNPMTYLFTFLQIAGCVYFIWTNNADDSVLVRRESGDGEREGNGVLRIVQAWSIIFPGISCAYIATLIYNEVGS
jgi:hypothetical protein